MTDTDPDSALETRWRGELTLFLTGSLAGGAVAQVIPFTLLAGVLAVVFASVVCADIWNRDQLDRVQQRLRATVTELVL